MQWVCEICGYVHDGEEPPPNCVVCGAPSSKFVEWTADNGGKSGDGPNDSGPDKNVD